MKSGLFFNFYSNMTKITSWDWRRPYPFELLTRLPGRNLQLAMVGCVKLSIQLPCNHRREPPPTFTIRCALSKQAHRFLTSLATTAVTDDPSVSTRQIRKFVHSSSKSIALNALSHLLCPDTSHPHLSSLAFPVSLSLLLLSLSL